MLVEAHHAAVEQVLASFEREVAATRVGANNGYGLVARVDVVGVAATAYDHYDSRAGDPQLHTHVVVSNKVKTAADGKWRTLNSQAVHAAVVAVSEYYNAVLADRLTATFGLGWQRRHRTGVDRSDKWEITGVSEELIGEFSNRSRAIDVAKDQLIAKFVAARGHQLPEAPDHQAARPGHPGYPAGEAIAGAVGAVPRRSPATSARGASSRFSFS